MIKPFVTHCKKMDKKFAHPILFFGDLISLAGLWTGHHIFSRITAEIAGRSDIITYGNRVGFFSVCIGFPLLHFIILIERYRPNLIKKYKSFLNYSVIAMVIILLTAGYAGSSWIKTQVENAGYVYCRNASGAGALAKTLVYTKNMEICDEIVSEDRRQAR